MRGSHLHEALSVALPHLTRSCKYHMTRAGCRKIIACNHRHAVPQKRVVLPPKDLCDLRSSNLFEYAPTRNNKRIEHDACSQHWSRVNDAAGGYPGKGPHIQMILFETTTHRSLGVLEFGGSVCLERKAAGCPHGGFD